MKKRVLRLILLMFVGLLAYAVLVEPAMTGYTTHEVRIGDLPKAFDGFKVVQISDIHVNRWMPPKRVRKVVARVNAMYPDIVVLTGDFVSRDRKYCAQVGEALTGIKAKHGVYAVLGNHDYWTDADAVTKALRAAGVDVLFDESRAIRIGKQRITLVGTDDCWEGDPDYVKAFSGVSSDDVCIAIAHNPDAVLGMEGSPVSFLMVGHTHGGLIKLPITGPVFSISRLGRHYSSGMFHIHGVNLYVSRGIGTGPIARIRFRCPPEVPVFMLRSDRSDTSD